MNNPSHTTMKECDCICHCTSDNCGFEEFDHIQKCIHCQPSEEKECIYCHENHNRAKCPYMKPQEKGVEGWEDKLSELLNKMSEHYLIDDEFEKQLKWFFGDHIQKCIHCQPSAHPYKEVEDHYKYAKSHPLGGQPSEEKECMCDHCSSCLDCAFGKHKAPQEKGVEGRLIELRDYLYLQTNCKSKDILHIMSTVRKEIQAARRDMLQAIRECMPEKVPPYPAEGDKGEAMTEAAKIGYQDALKDFMQNIEQLFGKDK